MELKTILPKSKRNKFTINGYPTHTIRIFNCTMKIEIDYNGSLAVCRVNGKPFNECDVNEQVFAMNAFRTIIKDWERQNKQLLP